LNAFGNFTSYIIRTPFTNLFCSHHTKRPGLWVTTIPVSKQCFMHTSRVGADKTPCSQFRGPRRWSDKQRGLSLYRMSYRSSIGSRPRQLPNH